jgi:hypothetical protein
MFVRTKMVKGTKYHYLVQNVRVNGKVRQRVLAYLGRYDCIEDAFANAVGQKRRARRARYRNVQDICNDQVLREAYKGQRRRWNAPASAIRVLLPGWV